MIEDDEGQDGPESVVGEVIHSTSNTIVPETQEETTMVQSQPLDPNKIYRGEENEILLHTSGMCYDLDQGTKTYYTIIDKEGGDLRALYYIQ